MSPSAGRAAIRRWLLLAFVGSLAGISHAATIESATSGNWSQPQSWVGGVVPSAGDTVHVQPGHAVQYDVESSEVIAAVIVHGKLIFASDVNTRLETGLLALVGDHPLDAQNPCAALAHDVASDDRPLLQIGTPTQPVASGVTAVIRLHAVGDVDTSCAPALISHGGRVDLHGAVLTPTWTKLAATAPAGAVSLEVDAAVNWSPGDKIIVVGTLWPPGRFEGNTIQQGQLIPETEQRIITAVSADGRTLTLDQPLQYGHRGGPASEDRRGEVANLSRNVIIESADPAGVRGHTMFHKHSAAAISFAEFRHLGKAGVLGRYPIHFHLVDDTMRGSYVRGASIWDSANRWVSIHGAEFLVVRDTVGFGSLGHGFFLENGAEVFNLLAGNLGVQSYVADPLPNQALAYDGNRGACYWAANARNFIHSSVFAECDSDMSFILEYAPDGLPMWTPMLQPDGSRQIVDAREISGGLIEGLEVHSVWGWGPWVRAARYPADAALVFRNSRIWRAHYSADISGDNVIFDGVRMLDSSYGFYNQFAGPHLVRNGYFDNIGPHGAFMTYLGGWGTFLYEDIQLRNSVLAFRMDAKNESGPQGSPIEHHVRNISVLTPRFFNSGGEQHTAWAGTEGDNVRTDPLLLLVHHDAIGPGLDRILMPSLQAETLPGVPAGLVFADATGITDGDGVLLEGRGAIRHAEGVVEWPDSPLQNQVDTLPPATTIVRPHAGETISSTDGALEVCGVSLDQNGVVSVTVNGAAAVLRANGFDWCATVNGLLPGANLITAGAIDTVGNAELIPHQIMVNRALPEVVNTAPIADAGGDRTVDVGSVVQLDGAGSSDPEEDPLGYAWSMIGFPDGSVAELADAATAQPSFTADLAGDYLIELIVNDGSLDSAADFVTITVQSPPDADGDGVPDVSDNCVDMANGTAIPDAGGHSQRDSDADGFGNMCDADLNNDLFVNFVDLALFRQRFGTADADADFDGNGMVNFYDLSRFRQAFGAAPGPSGNTP